MATTNSIACSLLQNESDDEESFVVLGHSLPPESLSVDCGCEVSESLNSTVVQESLKLTSNALSQLPLSTSSFPSLPKVDHHDLVIPSEENYSNHSIQSSVDLGPDEIQQKVDSLIKENIKLKETLHQNNLAMKKQYDTLMLWQADVQKVHQSHKEKFAETKKFIENLKIENAKLLEALKASQIANAKAVEELEQLRNQNPESKETLDSGDSSFQKSGFVSVRDFDPQLVMYQIKPNEMQNQSLDKPNATENEKVLTNKIEELEKELGSVKQLNTKLTEDSKKKLQESECLQKILLQEIKILKNQLNEKGDSTVSKEDHKKIQEQLVAAQMHLTKIELSRNEDKEIINTKEEVIAKLQEDLKEMTEAKDTIAALRAQLELYKSDFEAERQAKESLKCEKEQIAEDLQHLQRRNQQLLEEVEHLRNGDFVHVSRPEPRVPPSPSAPQDRTRAQYPCPKCDFRFWDYQALENHVYRCIEIDSLF